MFGGIVNPWCIDAFNKTSANPNNVFKDDCYCQNHITKIGTAFARQTKRKRKSDA